MTRLSKLLGIALAAAVGASAMLATGALASHTKHHKPHRHHKVVRHRTPRLRPMRIHCGMVVMRSIKVLNNLTCPVPSHPGPPGHGTPPFGLLVVGSHITVDLNGHTLNGPRVPGTSEDLALGHSVEVLGVGLNKANHDIVENGTVRHFDAGVSDSFGNHNTIRNITSEDNHNYEVVSGAIDYLPPSPGSATMAATGTGTTSYSYEIATAQAPNPAKTPGDNGTNGHSYTQDSLVSDASTKATPSSTKLMNSATLSATNYNTITFTGVGVGPGAAYATGYRILRSVNGGPFMWIGTVTPSSTTNTYTFVDQGQSAGSSYTPVQLASHNVSKDDTCDNGDGIIVDASNYDTVTSNTLMDNGPFSGVALVGEYNGKSYDGAGHNLVEYNTIMHNAVLNQDPGYNNPHNAGMNAYCGTGPGGGGMTRGRTVQDSGIRLEGPNAQHNLVRFNHVTSSGFNGIAIHSYVCTPSNESSNGVEAQPAGVPNSFNTITRNTVSYTGEFTPPADETNLDGIGWLASGPNNVVCVSPQNTVTNNLSFGNKRDGIYMGGRANHGNYVAGNVVRNNTNDGIEVAAGGPGYGKNTFTKNHGYANGNFDAQDENTNCGQNSWIANVFTKVSPSCIH